MGKQICQTLSMKSHQLRNLWRREGALSTDSQKSHLRNNYNVTIISDWAEVFLPQALCIWYNGKADWKTGEDPSIPMQACAASLLLSRCSAAHSREMAVLNQFVEWSTSYVETQAVTFWPCLVGFNTLLECTLNKENSFYENRCI